MGWNTWCAVGTCGTDHCTERQIKETIDALVSTGLASLGYKYVVLDDCWHPTRDPTTGRLVPNATSFPNGLAPLAAYAHSAGVKFGIYTSVGARTCRHDAGSYGHFEIDAQTFADWQIDYLKVDWCGPNVSAAGHRELSAALNATGRPIWLELCRGDYANEPAWGYAPAISQSWRATGDHHDDWGSVLDQLGAFVGQGTYSGPYGWAYGDMLMTGGQGCVNDPSKAVHCPGMSDGEYRSEFAAYATLGSPLLIGTDVRNITAIMHRVLFNLDAIAINQDPAAGGNFSTASAGCDQAIYRRLSTGKVAVVAINPDAVARDVVVCFGDVGVAGSAAVRDVWAKADLGVFSRRYVARGVGSHDNAFVLLSPSS